MANRFDRIRPTLLIGWQGFSWPWPFKDKTKQPEQCTVYAGNVQFSAAWRPLQLMHFWWVAVEAVRWMFWSLKINGACWMFHPLWRCQWIVFAGLPLNFDCIFTCNQSLANCDTYFGNCDKHKMVFFIEMNVNFLLMVKWSVSFRNWLGFANVYWICYAIVNLAVIICIFD